MASFPIDKVTQHLSQYNILTISLDSKTLREKSTSPQQNNDYIWFKDVGAENKLENSEENKLENNVEISVENSVENFPNYGYHSIEQERSSILWYNSKTESIKVSENSNNGNSIQYCFFSSEMIKDNMY